MHARHRIRTQTNNLVGYLFQRHIPLSHHKRREKGNTTHLSIGVAVVAEWNISQLV